MKLDLQTLLQNKSFDELTELERSFVLEQMSEQAYLSQRHVLQESKQLMEEESAKLSPLPISSPVLAALKKKQAVAQVPIKEEPKKKTFLIPLWQAAAACLLLMSLSFLMGKNSTQNSSEEFASVVYKRDTIFVETIKEVLQPVDTFVKVIYDTLFIEMPVNEPVFAYNDDSLERNEVLSFSAQEEDQFEEEMETMTASKGRPMSKDSFLQEISKIVIY